MVTQVITYSLESPVWRTQFWPRLEDTDEGVRKSVTSECVRHETSDEGAREEIEAQSPIKETTTAGVREEIEAERVREKEYSYNDF